MTNPDTRLPIRFGSIEDRQTGEAVLSDGDSRATEPAYTFRAGSTRHAMDCACCAPRSEAARALAVLFRQRAVGQGALFSGVLAVVSPEGERAIRAAAESDILVAARYRVT